MKEASTVIQIRYSYMGLGGIVSVILAIALLVITTITLFVIIVRKRRNRQLNEKVFPYKSWYQDSHKRITNKNRLELFPLYIFISKLGKSIIFSRK